MTCAVSPPFAGSLVTPLTDDQFARLRDMLGPKPAEIVEAILAEKVSRVFKPLFASRSLAEFKRNLIVLGSTHLNLHTSAAFQILSVLSLDQCRKMLEETDDLSSEGRLSDLKTKFSEAEAVGFETAWRLLLRSVQRLMRAFESVQGRKTLDDTPVAIASEYVGATALSYMLFEAILYYVGKPSVGRRAIASLILDTFAVCSQRARTLCEKILPRLPPERLALEQPDPAVIAEEQTLCEIGLADYTAAISRIEKGESF
jgi:hypothetical protein